MAREEKVTIDGPWAARVSVRDAAAAARLRSEKSIRVAVDADWLWLRGSALTPEQTRELQRVGPIDLYSVNADETLIAAGDLLPSGRLPLAPWIAIRDFYRPVPPPSLLSGVVETGTTLVVVPSSVPRTANALLTSLEALATWADDAAEVRMRPLRFAATQSHALVLGTPLPPIAGTRLYENDGICVAAGFELAPAVDAASLRLVLALENGDIALFEPGGWQRIPADTLTTFTRSSIRMTVAQGSQQ